MISVGVDIGTYSIKIAELESTARSYSVRRVLEIPFSQNLNQDRKIETIDALRNLFSKYDLHNTQFIFSIPEEHVSTRLRQFSFRERYKILKTVPFELEEDIPFSQEDAVFEAKLSRFVGKSTDVLAMAVPKDRIREILGLANDCGVQPAIISVETLALSNQFERWMDAPIETVALAEETPAPRPGRVVLDLGHHTTKVLIYLEGALVSVRSIDWGMLNLAQAIAQKYGLNALQAMRELQSKGFILLDKTTATKDQVAFSNVVETSLSDLVRMLQLKLLEVQAEFRLEFTSGEMVGGGSQLRNLGAFLTQKLEFPFNRFKQFEHHPSAVSEVTPALEAVTATAVGLAIEGLKRPKNPAQNFLRGEFEQQSQTFEAIWEKWAFTAKVLASVFVIFFVYAILRDSAALQMSETSIDTLKSQATAITGRKGRDASPSKIREFIKQSNREAKNRKQAERVAKLNSALDVLTALSQALPAGTGSGKVDFEVRRLTIDNERADLLGAVKNPADLARIEQALRTLAIGGKLDKLNVPQVLKTETAFGYRFNVQRFAAGG